MEFSKVILRRTAAQLFGCRRTKKIGNCNINTNFRIKNSPSKFSSKFLSHDFTENHHTHDFNNGYFKKFHSDKVKSNRNSALKKLIVGGVLIGSVTYLINKNRDSSPPIGEYNSEYPEFTVEQVAKHKTRNTGIWVTYKRGIYDVTDLVNRDPEGANNLLISAGGPLYSFPNLNNETDPEAWGALENYRIGNLKGSATPKNICFAPDGPGGAFEHEPQRDPRLIPITVRPFNGGVKSNTLVENWITPNEIFYVRNHLPVPYIPEEEYTLTVEVEGGGSKTFTLDDLKKLPQITRTLSLQCGGLRRQEMTDILKKDTQGVKWEINGVGNAVWRGVLLIDVLKAAGFQDSMEELQHLQFTSGMSAGGPYVTGIPIQRVLNPKNNIMVAWEMNGEKLHPDHGLPCRLVVPGLIGAKSVKQIAKIEVQKEECQAHWHQQLYKYFGPYVTLENVDYSSQPPVTELPVMSAILAPADKETVTQSGGKIPIKGFGFSGGGCKIVRIDVSVNRGKTWMPAKITDCGDDPVPYHYNWVLWHVDVPTSGKKCVDVWVKAVDSSGNTQPEFWEHIYNIRGVACTAYHKIRVNIN